MTSLARVQDVQMSLADTMTLGQVLKSSGFFVDVKEEAQAVAKILAGREIGIGPIASMTGIHIINGRMALGANVIAGRIKGSGRYDYRVREMTNERCEIEFFENYGGKRETIGKSEFTLADARKAQTKNIDKFPRNMLFARAISNGARWYTPDVFNGAVYTPDELGAETDEEGNVVDVTPVQTVRAVANDKRAKLLVRIDELIVKAGDVGIETGNANFDEFTEADLVSYGKALKLTIDGRQTETVEAIEVAA